MPCILTPVFLSKWKAKVALKFSLTFTSASRQTLFTINERCQFIKDEHFNQNVPRLSEKKSLEAWRSGCPPQLTLLSLLAEGNLKRKQQLLHLCSRWSPSLPPRRLKATPIKPSSLHRAESPHVRHFHNQQRKFVVRTSSIAQAPGHGTVRGCDVIIVRADTFAALIRSWSLRLC